MYEDVRCTSQTHLLLTEVHDNCTRMA